MSLETTISKEDLKYVSSKIITACKRIEEIRMGKEKCCNMFLLEIQALLIDAVEVARTSAL